MSGNHNEFDDDGDLRDPALRRALDHAPDSEATPDPRTRDAILKMAHNLAPAPVSTAGTAANTASARPWWRRLFGSGAEPHPRMPWNAAFATVLVAAFVTLLWRSEPVPDARLDGEARVGGAAAPAAEAPAAPAAPAPATAAAPEPAPPPAAAKQAPPAPAAPAAEQRAKVSRDAAPAKEAVRAQPSRREAAPAPTPVSPAPPAVVAEQAAQVPAQDERREERMESERRRAYAPAPAAPAPSVASPPAAAPLSRQSQDASALASQSGASGQASGALQDASPRAAKAAASRVDAPPSFSALERWTSFSSGAGTRRARGDVEGLPALVGTVARSATTPDAPFDAPVEARLSLYRGDTLIAVLEIAGDQVRWTPHPGGTALVGTPPTQALDALRALLAR
ncbi:hypothetical protein [Variovorax sp. Root411]|uniref:hypothetical protein n=1 Tax=Variovorax sp. Root411 TaxID=1736530 RepID=UPI000A836EE2|nr:hypothetical protein [Variovorax sp. Root411]